MCTASTHNTNVLLNYVVIYYTVVNSWEVVPFAILCFFVFIFIYFFGYLLVRYLRFIARLFGHVLRQYTHIIILAAYIANTV